MEWPKKKEIHENSKVSLMQLVENAKINEVNEAIAQCTQAAVEMLEGLKESCNCSQCLNTNKKIDNLIRHIKSGK